MSEWWTYSLSDFLLFSPDTYYRLIALYNQALWPIHVLAILGAIAVLRPLVQRQRGPTGGTFLLLAMGWVLCGILFHGMRYATINWAATWFAAGFLTQALLLAMCAYRLHRPAQSTAWTRGAGFLLLGMGFLVYPLLPLLAGRSSWEAEVFLVMPDPTVLVTLGFLVLHEGRSHWLLLPLPLLWCAISGATLLAMDSATAFLLPLAGLLATLFIALRHRPSGA